VVNSVGWLLVLFVLVLGGPVPWPCAYHLRRCAVYNRLMPRTLCVPASLIQHASSLFWLCAVLPLRHFCLGAALVGLGFPSAHFPPRLVVGPLFCWASPFCASARRYSLTRKSSLASLHSSDDAAYRLLSMTYLAAPMWPPFRTVDAAPLGVCSACCPERLLPDQGRPRAGPTSSPVCSDPVSSSSALWTFGKFA